MQVDTWYQHFMRDTSILRDINALDGSRFPRLPRPTAAEMATVSLATLHFARSACFWCSDVATESRW